jgi:hypothetical protein
MVNETESLQFVRGDTLEILQCYIETWFGTSRTINQERPRSAMRDLRIHVMTLALVALNGQDVPNPMHS